MNFSGPHCPSVPYHSRWDTAAGPTHFISAHPVSVPEKSRHVVQGWGPTHLNLSALLLDSVENRGCRPRSGIILGSIQGPH